MIKAIETAKKNSLAATGKTVEYVWESVAKSVDGMNRNTFSELLNGLWAGCGRTAAPDKTVLRVWYFCLHDLSESQLANGIARYLTQHSKEYLTVQLIRELSGAQEAKEAEALGAWDEAIEAVRIVGSYRSPAFTHPTTSHVIQSLGGWDWFCGQNPEELRSWVRQRFLKTFEAMAASVKTREPARLTNLLTKSGGNLIEMPLRIGTVLRRIEGVVIDSPD